MTRACRTIGRFSIDDGAGPGSVRVLITGASGLVGGRLIGHLLDAGGVTVRAASRVSRAWPVNVEGVVTDAADVATLNAACADVDAVVNLSSMPERLAAEDPQRALRDNTGGTLAIVTAAARAGVRRFVQLSTFKVYDNTPAGLVTEETPTRPTSHYAITHRASEDYASQHPDAVIFRLANGFGAPAGAAVDCWTLIANEMCREAAVSRTITIRSAGLSWRNFVPLNLVVDALHFATGALPAGTYNLGALEAMTLRDIAERVATVAERTLGYRPAVTFGPAGPGDHSAPLDFRSDKLARAGFHSAASVDAELRRTLLMARDAFAGVTA